MDEDGAMSMVGIWMTCGWKSLEQAKLGGDRDDITDTENQNTKNGAW